MSVDHRSQFVEFVKRELAVGGPDPQLDLLLALPPACTPTKEVIWLIGCYCSHHCVPSAFAVWENWRPEEVYFDSAGGNLEKWLRDNWEFLPVRPEMRSHRMPEKRAKCLKDFAQYALEWTPERTAKPYQVVWDDAVKSVKFFGRYMAIKYLEFLRRGIPAPNLEMPDLRAKGSWSPRMTMSWFYPEAVVLAERGNESKEALRLVDEYAVLTRDYLREKGAKVNLFQLQVLLCEYRELTNGGFYPGGGHDEEMDYIATVNERFDMTMLLEARRRLFPHEYLGEIGGWHGIRKEKFEGWKEFGRTGVVPE